MLRFLSFAVLTLLVSPALAGATAWQDLAPGVKARFISSDVVDSVDHTLLAGLELDMPETTHTYWRIPGETGIPAQFDFAGSDGLAADPTIIWPYPEIDHTGGYTGYVYRGHIVLPMKFKVTDASHGLLSVGMTLGVCSDVCVPAMARFSLPISYGAPDGLSGNWLQYAIQRSPDDWDQVSQPFGPLHAAADGLVIDSMDATIDPDSVIVDAGDPSVLFATPQKSPENGQWILKLLGKSDAKALQGRTVQLTFTATSLHFPYAVIRQVLPAS